MNFENLSKFEDLKNFLMQPAFSSKGMNCTKFNRISPLSLQMVGREYLEEPPIKYLI